MWFNVGSLWAVSWITWWVFLSLKLSGAWANVSWWAITAPLWSVGVIAFLTVAIGGAAIGSASATAYRNHVNSL